MAEALLEMYRTMTAVEQKELYDFAMFILSRKEKKQQNPLQAYCGIISNEDAKTMMAAIADCRRIEPNEW